SDRARWAVVRDEIHEIQKKYGDKRRTRIGGAGAEELEYSEEAFIADEDAHVVLTRDGWIKRVREIKDPSQTRVREGDEVAFALAPHAELSTRAGRRFSRPAKEDEIIGVVPVGDRDRLAVVTEKSHWLIVKANEINELAGPGRGVTVLKTSADDKVVAFLNSSHRDAAIQLESSKGRKLELTVFGHDPASRGGHGRQ